MNALDFWDNPDKANKVVTELKTTKALLTPVTEAQTVIDDARMLWEMAEEADDDDTRKEVDEQIDSLKAQLDKLEMLSLLSGKYDNRNCIITT